MRGLVVVLVASAARADPPPTTSSARAAPLTMSSARAAPLFDAYVLVRHPTDARSWHAGADVFGGDDIGAGTLIGYHFTDRWYARARARFTEPAAPTATELDVAYAIGVGKLALPYPAILRLKLFMVAGGGVTSAHEPTAHGGLMLRTYPFGVDWVALELGTRGRYARYAPSESTLRARTIAPVAAHPYATQIEVSAAMLFLLPPNRFACSVSR